MTGERAFHAGTLTAIVGPNGAGKTTYFNLISGQLPASAGQVLLDGRGHHRARRGRARHAAASAAPSSSPTCFPNLTVHENVRLAVQAAPAAAPTVSRWNAGATGSSSADAFLEACHSPTSAMRAPWPCRTATSASSRWRS